jgi:hypothetical protein
LRWTAAPGLGWRNRARGRRRRGDRECKGQPPPGRACAFFRDVTGSGRESEGKSMGLFLPFILGFCFLVALS